MDKKVCILGLGYIGLPTALLLADAGVSVVGFDTDAEKRDKLQRGELYFEEKGLEDLFARVVEKNTFSASSEVTQADVYIIAVPTPVADGVADLQYVCDAIDMIKDHFTPESLIIVESTVGPKDCVSILVPRIEAWGVPFKFAHCTERAIPGNTLYEMVHNDRVIGGVDGESNVAAKAVYDHFMKGEMYLSDPTTAAVCKVMENTYRSVNIALANEFAQLSAEIDFNVWEAIALANKHPRVNIHQPGPGVGGHCIPIDPYFLVTEKNKNGIVQSALSINKNAPNYICAEVKRLLDVLALENPTVAVLGYAYKKDVDDARETPAKNVIETLSQSCKVLVTDPYVQNSSFVPLEVALEAADAVLVVTDHAAYTEINFGAYQNISFVYDTRNCITQSQLSEGSAKLYTLGT